MDSLTRAIFATDCTESLQTGFGGGPPKRAIKKSLRRNDALKYLWCVLFLVELGRTSCSSGSSSLTLTQGRPNAVCPSSKAAKISCASESFDSLSVFPET